MKRWGNFLGALGLLWGSCWIFGNLAIPKWAHVPILVTIFVLFCFFLVHFLETLMDD